MTKGKGTLNGSFLFENMNFRQECLFKKYKTKNKPGEVDISWLPEAMKLRRTWAVTNLSSCKGPQVVSFSITV